MKMWNAPVMILVASILLEPATPFEHPGRIHHRRPPQEPSPPEETEVSYHSEESIPWRTQVSKRGRPSKDGSCIKNHEFTVDNQNILSSTCNYLVGNNTVPNRLPSTIHEVRCVTTGCRCSEKGDYRCTQLITPMEVIMFGHRQDIKPFQHTRKIIKVKSACVCAVTGGNHISVVTASISRR